MTDTKWRIGKSFAKYSKQAATPFDRKRKGFYIGTVETGSVLEDDARLIASRVKGFVFDGNRLTLVDEGMTEEARAAALAAAASLLRDEGRITAWRDELLDVRPIAGGSRLAVMERSAFRLLGLVTVAVHMNGVASDGRIWTSQRSDSKAINPGKWDNLAAGMVSAGETPEEAMRREAHEEAGLSESDYELAPYVTFFSSRPTTTGWMLERTLCYNASLRDGVIPRNLDGEVQATELLDPDQMAELVARGKVTAEASLAVLAWLAERTGKILPEGFYKPFRP
ncbi:MAG: DUF4743 domain-containing protein [Sutterellaceae bacterium]|nr:DUF4743 domain-containing protein [Sutterellaceae bacterium]MDD7441977.1 DUF4743 domain-containing protein [Sutterellaceae bacterium]MDY2867813.1 DUF4743 domain-containing protein [Mesosutterella sp.]